MFFPRSDKEKKPVEISVTNHVSVLVWLPKLEGRPAEAKEIVSEINAARKEGEGRRVDANVGHVAMITPNRYVSLWPAESARGDKYKVVNAAFSTMATDIRSEGGNPDTIVTLYSLDVQSIESAFDEIQYSEDGFVLAGDKLRVRLQNDRKGRNCNGLVYELLQRGGVDKVTPFGGDSALSLYISPDKFDPYIRTVKEKEIALYPQTVSFKMFDGEYRPAPQPVSKLVCS